MQHKGFRFGVAAIAASALVVSACSNGSTDSSSDSATTSAAASATSSVASGATAHTGSDVMFAQGMIPHHQQAIEMSDMLLGKQDIDPEVVSLAEQIKSAQGPEIEQMQGWLQEWGVGSTPPEGGAMPGHQMPGHDMPGHQMPAGGDMGSMPGMPAGGHGMMSQADMAALQNAQGAGAGRLFLTQMITHHEGAIMMAQREIEGGQYPAAVDMARTIVSSQQAEIDQMRAMLAG
ncbi:DUF305 domain-containing protein [Mycolicibacterium gilvum]|uniref:Lipoprotein n=1 Tax=Mycolicibacterium gilvum TaxID=1804 RepID=A0A378SKK4_9MYCO|nr:DUF305 domain-containing protein [Mycolicibacterium gilvum]MCV7053609.1 DUF305 domain-containing protein [Mycolicibacterium gilvum]STZ43203.1 lipoprotein [Mycolicibacterium gilvum]